MTVVDIAVNLIPNECEKKKHNRRMHIFIFQNKRGTNESQLKIFTIITSNWNATQRTVAFMQKDYCMYHDN